MRSGDRIRPVEAVTFDVGLTLLFRPDRVLRRRLRAELSAWLDAHGLRVESDRFRRLSSEAEVTYARLSADGREPEASKAAADFVTSLELDLTVDDRAQLQRMVEGLFRDYPTRPTSGAVDALRRLRERGVRLGIVSNRGRRPGWIAQQYLEICGLASFFEPGAIAWSDEVGWRKPDPRIFLLARRTLSSATTASSRPRSAWTGSRRRRGHASRDLSKHDEAAPVGVQRSSEARASRAATSSNPRRSERRDRPTDQICPPRATRARESPGESPPVAIVAIRLGCDAAVASTSPLRPRRPRRKRRSARRCEPL
jgi:FMN phosphatase YigB (HAD superfamily)